MSEEKESAARMRMVAELMGEGLQTLEVCMPGGRCSVSADDLKAGAEALAENAALKARVEEAQRVLLCFVGWNGCWCHAGSREYQPESHTAKCRQAARLMMP